jgi:type VI secretion system secreted protein Hcp
MAAAANRHRRLESNVPKTGALLEINRPIHQCATMDPHKWGGPMAIDVYLQLEGIKGESADAQHKDWIECQTASWMVTQPQSASSSSSGGHTAERCFHTGIDLRKVTDLSTPILLQYCSMGKTIPSAKFEFYRADSLGQRIKYFAVELTNILITDVAPEIHEGELMSEHVTLGYSKVKWLYTQQKIGGGARGSVAGGWDLATNRIV